MANLEPESASAAEILGRLERLRETGRVLYVAAHPDDENTRLLTHLVRNRHLRAAYLSMTRGGGGQNLIGSEQAELLDVIRTEELLAARRLDGAEQRFTRMRDFGYSKSAEETFAIWGKEEALADVVWVIRSFQPDVVVTRFDERPPNHGHHTASAILAREAFHAAGDPGRFTEQLAWVKPWKAKRLIHNVPTWREAPEPPANAVQVDVGTYDVGLGLSHGELASFSRSQHKSQGFGVPGERGRMLESFVALEGDHAADPFDAIGPSWSELGADGLAFSAALDRARRSFSFEKPEGILVHLEMAATAMKNLPSSARVDSARIDLENLIVFAAGLFLRATAERPTLSPGGTGKLKVEAVARRASPVHITRIQFPNAAKALDVEALPALAPAKTSAPIASADGVNLKREWSEEITLPADAAVGSHHWLRAPSLRGRFEIDALETRTQPLGNPALSVTVTLALGKYSFDRRLPLLHSWTDRVHGERLRRVVIAPPATVTPTRDAYLIPGKSTVVGIRVRAGKDGVSGRVSLDVVAPWRAVPESVDVALKKAGDEQLVEFTVSSPPKAVRPRLTVTPRFDDGRVWSWREDAIDYPHIPYSLVLSPARFQIAPVQLVLPKGRKLEIGYIEGPGDTVAADLEHVGLTVERLNDDALERGNLNRFRAIVVGIRAYNARASLHRFQPRLMAYVEAGGTLLVSYQTQSRFAPLPGPIGPYPLEIGRGRVTDENARMMPIDGKAALWTRPNLLDESDYEGWVQERGLYYGAKWDAKYRPWVRMHDANEAPEEGAIVTARHGRGVFIYTGLSFFRQLPAGVPGAYRLLVNLLSLDAKAIE